MKTESVAHEVNNNKFEHLNTSDISTFSLSFALHSVLITHTVGEAATDVERALEVFGG